MFRRQLFTTASVLQYLQPIICGCSNVILLGLSYHEQTASLKCLHIMDHSSRTVHAHTNVFQSCENDFENGWLFKGIVCLVERPWCSKSVFMAGDSMRYFFIFFIEAGLIGIAISFDVLSCNGISRGKYVPLQKTVRVGGLQSNQTRN